MVRASNDGTGSKPVRPVELLQLLGDLRRLPSLPGLAGVERQPRQKGLIPQAKTPRAKCRRDQVVARSVLYPTSAGKAVARPALGGCEPTSGGY